MDNYPIETIIDVSSGKLSFSLNFHDRINIIRGDSATGKSTLVRLINNYLTGKGGTKLKSNKIVNIFNINMLNNIPEDFEQRNLYILDEGMVENTIEFAQTIASTNSIFIIISRKSLRNIKYSSKSIYELKYLKDLDVYINSKIYEDLNISSNKDKLNNILVEDSKSGYEFFKNYGLDINTSNGNTYISRNIKDNQIIIFDDLGIGPYIEEIVSICKNYNTFIISPKSFEYMLLKSNIFKEQDINDLNTWIYQKYYNNLEEYYFRLLREVSKLYNNDKLIYNKSKLQKWYLEETQFNKINKYIVDTFKINLKELSSNNEKESIRWC